MNKVCVFDLDGTLIDSLLDLAVAGNYLMEQLNYPTHPVESYKWFVGSGIKNLILRAAPMLEKDNVGLVKALNLYLDYYALHCSENTTIYPGIIELLDGLKANGFILGVVTNKPDSIAKKLVKDLFAERFTYVYGQVPHIPVKPDPTLVLQILSEANANLNQSYYIGDSDVDIYTAQNADLPSIGCLWGNRGYEELKAAGATYLASDAKDIYTIVMEGPDDYSE